MASRTMKINCQCFIENKSEYVILIKITNEMTFVDGYNLFCVLSSIIGVTVGRSTFPVLYQ
jgi:hypothetical protein